MAPGGFRFYSKEAEPIISFFLKDTTTSVVARGDLLQISTDDAIRMSTTTDNLSFLGIALADSPAGENNKFAVMTACPHNCGIPVVYDLDTATSCARNANLAFASSGNGTSFQQLNPTNTDKIMRCHQSNSGSSALQVVVTMLVPVATNDWLGDAS